MEMRKKKDDKAKIKSKDEKKDKIEEIEAEKEEKEESGESENFSARIEELEAENTSIKDDLLRKAAEFENYKRRTDKDLQDFIKYAAEQFIVKIIPVFDDLERSLAHIDDKNNDKSIREGLKLVYEKFKKTLDEQGVKKIDAKGKPFDFNFHEALMQQPAADVPPHTVLEEIEPGYMYKDKVIKHSKVIVSQEMAESNSDESKQNSEKE